MAESLLTSRDRIVRLLEREPGLHLRELPRRLDMSLRAVRHHLGVLEREGLVVSNRHGRYLRWFGHGSLSSADRALVASLRVRGERKVLLVLLRLRRARYSRLAAETGLPTASLARCLRNLIRDELVARDPHRSFHLTDSQALQMRLSNLSSRFPDLLADAAWEIFEETM